jgi:transcription elongation factor GreA-like protein
MNEKLKKRRQFTLKEKLTILEKIDAGKKKRDVARESGIAPSTLPTILKHHKRIEDKIKETALGPQRKNIRNALHDIDKAVFFHGYKMFGQEIPKLVVQ